MAEKRFQVFVSSTYRDLVEERQKVAQVLQSMDCIPAGMELFPAIDEEQFAFIKRIIDDCDYYILILGGCYGSRGSDGPSYTEKEFDHAVEKGLRVIAFLRDELDALPPEKRDPDPDDYRSLLEFRERVANNRLVKMWTSPDELVGAVAVSLQQTIKAYPAPGWIRDTGTSHEALLTELNDLLKEKERLKAELSALQEQVELQSEDLASGDDRIMLTGWWRRKKEAAVSWSKSVSWDRILYHLGPHLHSEISEDRAENLLASAVVTLDIGKGCDVAHLDSDLCYTLRLHLEALGLIEVRLLGTYVGWKLTPKGRRLLIAVRVQRPIPF